MSSAQQSPAAKAIGYAEETLRVHHTYVEAERARAELEKAATKIAEWNALRREAEEALKDRDMELTANSWADHPDFSATKMEGFVRSLKQSDEFSRILRKKLSEYAGQLQRAEHDKLMAETDIRIAVARMNELGGYLSYLAAVKQANNTEKLENRT